MASPAQEPVEMFLDHDWFENMDLVHGDLSSGESPSTAENAIYFPLTTPITESDLVGTDGFQSTSYFCHYPTPSLDQSHTTADNEFGIDLRELTEASTATTFESCRNEETCMILGINTLRLLHIPYPATFCILNQSTIHHQPRMVDEALSKNESALDTVRRISECSCISKKTIRLVLLIICEKLISWNAVILWDQREERASASKSLFESDGMSRIAADNHVPIRVGHFSADASLGGRIRACIVLDTLERLQKAIGNIVRQPSHGDASGDNSNGLVEMLDRRLKDLMAEATTRLQDDRLPPTRTDMGKLV
ncbi:hypothetical protein F4677DRAFT_433530 [Hypoxylon crocopeplum]|nr:hypothetical protein F4677DRAFT_433530 [Hypoxylon crocopeplum]